MYRPPVPVEMGQQLVVKIDAPGPSGQGLAHLDNDFVVYVAGGRVGESVKVKITHLARTYAEAKKIG